MRMYFADEQERDQRIRDLKDIEIDTKQLIDQIRSIINKIYLTTPMPLCYAFNNDVVTLVNQTVFNDVLFYAYNIQLRYKPFEPFTQLTQIPIKDDYPEVLNDKEFWRDILFKSLSTNLVKPITADYDLTIEASTSVACAHFLPYYKGLCSHLHGHEWKIVVRVARDQFNHDIDLDAFSTKSLTELKGEKKGMLLDFGDLKKILKEHIHNRFDHNFLNDLMPNPTAENIAIYIYNHLYKIIEEKQARLVYVAVYETSTNKVELK